MRTRSTATWNSDMKKKEDLKREVYIRPNPAKDEVQIYGMARMEVATIAVWTRSGHAISLKEKQNGNTNRHHTIERRRRIAGRRCDQSKASGGGHRKKEGIGSHAEIRISA